ncbi:triose-phosphate isomerase [Buchnera aphidicola]|uniref:triose-phosphate isomerase n=1 Tax=Buchnera aphidicola TaxID=9 RepID=UPI003463D58B
MKNFIVAGNWKLNGNHHVISIFMNQLKTFFHENQIVNTIIFIPPVVYLNSIKNIIQNKNFFLGSQNVDIHLSGSFTGEISICMLKDINVKYVIIGHSERRKFHNETNRYIANKLKIIKKHNIIPILCIGESIEEKKLKKSEMIIRNQIDDILNISGNNAFNDTIIAYEPIWAIGTGKSANIKEVKKINTFIKKYISENSNTKFNEVKIQYGGSINSNNILEFFSEKYVDGVLIGNSSLIYEQFIKIIKLTNKIR